MGRSIQDEKEKVMKDRKWMRGLSKGMIDNVLSLKPKDVKFVVDAPELIVCTIITGDNTLVKGISICGVLDKQYFNVRQGKRIAVQRALHAIKSRKSSLPIRNISDFPRRWIPSQIKQLVRLGCSYHYKSVYV